MQPYQIFLPIASVYVVLAIARTVVASLADWTTDANRTSRTVDGVAILASVVAATADTHAVRKRYAINMHTNVNVLHVAVEPNSTESATCVRTDIIFTSRSSRLVGGR